MIARLIRWSASNLMLVLIATVLATGAGLYAVTRVPLDAIPDLSDTQVIIYTEYTGQAPQVIEDQVTYPLSTAMLAVPGAVAVRGYSFPGDAYVYVIFEDRTDLYWARSRVLEYLNQVELPAGAKATLGPDATGVGWVYQYALVDRSGRNDVSQLRSLQDWFLKFELESVPGVAEVATVGGMVKQYQVEIDPDRLRGYYVTLERVRQAISDANRELDGSVIELAGAEYMVRLRGYLKNLEDLALISVPTLRSRVALTEVPLGDLVREIRIGPAARRGVADLDGEGEVVGGIVVMRAGANARATIDLVKQKLASLKSGLPPGVELVETYDRSALVARASSTLGRRLLEELLIVIGVCAVFLLHWRSSLVVVVTLPIGILTAFLLIHWQGINANIMSLGGIAISIGVVVDSAIIMVENAHKHLDREEERLHADPQATPTPRHRIMLEAAQEVGPQLFFSLLIITVSFLPVFVLGGEAGRLFKPLAFTKTFAMAAAALLSITIIPVLMYYFITSRVLPKEWGVHRNTLITLASMFLPAAALYAVASSMPHLSPYRWWFAGGWAVLTAMLLLPQKIIHEKHSPISRVLQWMYAPFFRAVMAHPWITLLAAVLVLASTYYPITRMGTEFMPPLDEGDLLYMPTTDPSISITKSKELLQQTDKLIATFPEVISVHGKIGRADTATDPAPLSMIETVAQLNPDRSQWRARPVAYWFSGWPGWLKRPFTATFWPESRPITTEELKFPDGTMHHGLNTVVMFPGVANAWPYPIENRINMLATGIKTPVGIKIMGPDLKILSDLAERASNAVRTIPGTVSAYAERTFGGYYLDVDVNREAAARYGLTVGDVQDVIQSAVGGMNVTTTVEGPERYPLNVRYLRDFRDDLPALENVLVTAPMSDGRGNTLQVPLGQLAMIRINPGAPMIRSENAMRTAWIYVDIAGRDLGGYIAEARRVVAQEVELPAGYTLVFSGQFEFWEKTIPRLIAASALAFFAIVFLLYVSSRSWVRVGIVLMAVPFSLVGAFWFMHALDYNLSLAVVIGIIALAGLDAETGMVMLLYLENSFDRFREQGRMRTTHDLWDAVHDGAVMRIRPKAMTVAATFIGLVPLLWAHGTGADTMRRIAAPMIGGLLISFVMELLIYPVVFYLIKRWQHRKSIVRS